MQVGIKYHVFDKEIEMLTHFCKWFNKNHCDVLTGWNVDGFDIPYMINRIKKVCSGGTVDLLSPINDVKSITKIDKVSKKSIVSYSIEGISTLDYQFLYKDKFNIVDKKPNYKLDTIAEFELGVGKMHYEGSITDFWRNKFEDFVEYNVIDVERVFQLEDKLKYIDLTRMICNFGLCEYISIYKSAPYIYGALTLQCRSLGKVIISSTPGENLSEGFEGAHVWPTVAGMYRRGVASFDLASLYPNIICTVNISPETKIGKIIDDSDPDNLVMKLANGRIKYLNQDELTNLQSKATRASNGVYYINPDTKEGIMPSFISRLYSKRVEFKGKMNEAKQAGNTDEANHFDRVQHATKIFLNSIYGQLGSRYFPMFDLDNAEAVTLTGQQIIKNTGHFVNNYLHKVYKSDIENHIVAGDTDSVYVRVDPIINKVIGEDGDMENHLQELITEVDKMEGQINKFASAFVKKKLLSPRDRIVFERETFCTQGAFLAKKRYILRVRNSDGARNSDGTYKIVEKFKYTGVEVKKSEHPDAIKEELKFIIENSLREPWSNKKYHEEIDRIWKKFISLPPDDIAFWKGYNTTKDSPGFLQAEKGANAHAKAAIFHNQLLEKFGLQGKYEEIHQGDRIRFAYLNKNNPYGLAGIGWLENWYPEFDEVFEIDRVRMFDKIFLKALANYEKVNGWRPGDPTRAVLVELDDL
jgi:DNA polymerase elongation subunit (family B)